MGETPVAAEPLDTVAAAAAVLQELIGGIAGEVRPGQSAMTAAVAEAMGSRRHLIVQAGTGTGKSFAYLVPALLHAVANQERVLVSTATIALQRQLMAKDIPVVIGAVADRLPRRPAVALLKGRGNYLCRLRIEESDSPAGGADPLFEIPGRLEAQAAALRRWAESTRTGDRDDLPDPVDGRVWRAMSATGRECVGRQRCPVGNSCFSEAARDEAFSADLIVTNHAMLAIDLAADANALPEYDVAIIDEAHELAARITAAATQELTVPLVVEAARRCTPLVDPPIAQALADAADGFAATVAGTAIGGEARLSELPERLVRALALIRDSSYAAVGALTSLQEGQQPSAVAAALASCTDVHDHAGRLLEPGDALVRWATAEPPGLTCAPITVADRIGGALLRRATVIATSATLKVGGSFVPLAVDWGLPGKEGGGEGAARWTGTDAGSPFDYPKQAILYLPGDLPPPGRDGIGDEALARIGALIRAAGGRSLVLASSWRAVDRIAEYLRDAEVAAVLVQERGSPSGPLVASFAAHEESVLVGTLSLWQGVDVPGPACSAVIIEKIPFPRPDEPVLAARSEAAAAAGRSGFSSVALPYAGQLLAQGAGRLIRSGSDRGVVAVLDSRIVNRSYGAYLVKSMPPMWTTSDTAVVLSALRRLTTASDPA